jgi:hypothetical protein
MLVSADIVQFLPRPSHDSEQTDFPVIAFRSAGPEVAADITPSEFAVPDESET